MDLKITSSSGSAEALRSHLLHKQNETTSYYIQTVLFLHCNTNKGEALNLCQEWEVNKFVAV